MSAPPPPAPSISVPELLTQRLPPPSPTVTTTPSPSLSPLTHPLYTSAGDAQSPLLTSLTRLICLSSIFLFCWSPPSQRNRNRGNWSACLSLRPPPLPAPSSGPPGWLAGWLAGVRAGFIYFSVCLGRGQWQPWAWLLRSAESSGQAAVLASQECGWDALRCIYPSPAAGLHRAEPGLPGGPWGALDSLGPVWRTPRVFWGDQSLPCL